MSLIEQEMQAPHDKLYEVLNALSPGYGDQFEPIAGFHMPVHQNLLKQRLQSVIDENDNTVLNVFAAVYGSLRIPRTGHLKKISLMIVYKILFILYDSEELPGLEEKVPESISFFFCSN